ncbi:hypothetical protein [Enterobacter sp. 276E10]|uniref:hypothetical protein n=1 Tax=Enterobacter TaxID=547 RepID=UPI002A818B0D|nr:hypothetical protein [Enterobacter sp. 276E10]
MISTSTPPVWTLLPAATATALAEMRGAAGAAYFAGRLRLPGFCARADRRLNRLPGKISY